MKYKVLLWRKWKIDLKMPVHLFLSLCAEDVL